MKLKKINLISIVLLCSIGMNALLLPVFAQEPMINIDGNFHDWISENEQKQTINNSEFRFFSTFQDQDATYLHIIAKPNGSPLQGNEITYIDEIEKEHKINFSGVDKDPFNLLVKDTDYKVVEGAIVHGSLQDNAREWEIKLPKAATGNIVKFIFQKTEITNIPVLGEQAPLEPEEPEANSGKISIDGFYNDWDNLHHVDIGFAGSIVSKACAVLQGDEHKNDNICIHVGSTYREDNHLNLDNINIAINDGKSVQIKLRQYNEDGSISIEPLSNIKQNKKYKMAAIIQVEGSTYKIGEAFYSTKFAHNREDFEFCILIKSLEEALGLPENSIGDGSKIEITFPSIGDGSIIIEGTNTGPIIGIGLCIGIVIITLMVAKRKVQRK